MIKWVFVGLMLAASANAAVLQIDDGVRIGPDSGGRVPIQNFDEYGFNTGLGEMTANEVRTVDFGECPTFYAGQQLVARLSNPQYNNTGDLLILHVWYDTTVSPNALKVMFRNLSNSTVDFGNDGIIIGGWNTGNPSP